MLTIQIKTTWLQLVPVLLMMMLLSFIKPVQADDIDILEAEKPVAPPNVLFIMDVSGSMRREVGSNDTAADPADSRLGILRNALTNLLTDPDLTDVNVGLMSFSGHSGNWLGHGPSYPVAPIDGDAATILNQNSLFVHPGDSWMPAAGGVTTRGYLQQIAATWNAENGTPLVDALFEGAKYMRGEDVYWGNKPPSELQAAHPSTYDGLFISDGTTQSTFECITEVCGNLGGVECNRRSTCADIPQTTTLQCEQPNCGTTCTLLNSTPVTCAPGQTFCASALSPAQCTTTTNPPILHSCTDVSDLACLTANPTWTTCSLVSTGVGVNTYSCSEPVPDTVTCDSTLYSCSTNSIVTSCSHEVCSTIETSGEHYISPISEECQNNAIILLSDGKPTVNDTSPLVAGMIGSAYSNNCDTSSDDKGRCGPEIAKFLAESDNSVSINGDQPITTHTVGFALGSDDKAREYLETLASSGNGSFYSADTSEDLVHAFKDAITGVNKKARLFSSPAYTADKQSRLSHGEVVYLPLFNRESRPYWSGNLKKFKINQQGQLIDVNGELILSSTGDLKPTAIDFWSAGAVNHAVKEGGVASLMDPAKRKDIAWTNVGSSLKKLKDVSRQEMGYSSDDDDSNYIKSSDFDDLVDFILGKDLSGDPRHHMGDIIHSKPVVFDYQYSDSSKNRSLVFVGTNEGYLHAFQDETGDPKKDGREAFSYLPAELFKNVSRQLNSHYLDDHVYGVDGEITLWFDDQNHNGKIDSGSDKVMLYFGLRRGGRSYYALDVTDPDNPVLAWKISHTQSDFSQLGYTWSKPKLASIKVNQSDSESTRALIFGGGYVDDNQGEADDSGTGANVYIVNAKTGAKIWSSNDSRMTHAIAANVRVMDVDRNGVADRLYVADTGGKLWRIDLDAGTSIGQAKIYLFADLNGASKRTFFNEPDVAFFKYGAQYLMSIAIGSGDRPRPLDKASDDRFFVLFDNHPMTYSATETVVEPIVGNPDSDLVAAPVTAGVDLVSTLRSKKGWYQTLTDITAEKVLSTALTFENKVMFTTFGMGSTQVYAGQCEISTANESRLYVMDLLSGNAVFDLNGQSGNEISGYPVYGEILDTPKVFFPRIRAKDGSQCKKGDCIRPAEILHGKGSNPVASPSPNPQSGIPQVYWIHNERD